MFLDLFPFPKGHVVTRDQRKYHKANNCPFNKILKVVKIPILFFKDENLHLFLIFLPFLQFAKLPEFSENKEYCEKHSDDGRHGNLVINLRKLVHHVGVGIGKMLQIIVIIATFSIKVFNLLD